MKRKKAAKFFSFILNLIDFLYAAHYKVGSAEQVTLLQKMQMRSQERRHKREISAVFFLSFSLLTLFLSACHNENGLRNKATHTMAHALKAKNLHILTSY